MKTTFDPNNFPAPRKIRREVKIGDLTIGGNNPVIVQSMTTGDTRDVDSVMREIDGIIEAGVEIIRITVPDKAAADAMVEIRKRVQIPIVADIHFNHLMALYAIDAGVDKIRLNPGNIKKREDVIKVVQKAKDAVIPIRIGVNAGSLDPKVIEETHEDIPAAMVLSAKRHISILEELDFNNIVISLKASDVTTCVKAHMLMLDECNYPFHIGITEAGSTFTGGIKSAVGLGILLAMGIGDTMRVSLTGDSRDEVKAAFEMLKALGLRHRGVKLVSCPTCGRCEIDVIGLANEIEKRTAHIKTPMDVAIMGCGVNGPGEAKEAEIGIVGGRKSGALYKDGKPVGKFNAEDLLDTLLTEIEDLNKKKS